MENDILISHNGTLPLADTDHFLSTEDAESNDDYSHIDHQTAIIGGWIAISLMGLSVIFGTIGICCKLYECLKPKLNGLLEPLLPK